uniref:Uncharacterized protein AlNc14C284G10157 n=1 Tax=Albugo laibachii Nc14 TaxID=890382 RepID=F0WV12_9STRA|nr:conserved hypothetical protein [Albugo laibachii Nc14]|eukprot:CCA25248.1 conserved hypothetical protein [Albugo laibachii Nc14]
MTGQQGHIAAYTLHTGSKIQVVQDTRRVDGLGGEVWPGGYVLCSFLEKHQTKYCVSRKVIELGAGCGMCSLLASELGAESVLSTDEYTDLLITNVITSKSVSIATLVWGQFQAMECYKEQFDVVLGSEITQLGRQAHALLVETINFVLRPSSTSAALLSMDLCRQTCCGECDIYKCTTSHFISVAKGFGFLVKLHNPVQLVMNAQVQKAVGALGNRFPIDEKDWSIVIELRTQSNEKTILLSRKSFYSIHSDISSK